MAGECSSLFHSPSKFSGGRSQTQILRSEKLKRQLHNKAFDSPPPPYHHHWSDSSSHTSMHVDALNKIRAFTLESQSRPLADIRSHAPTQLHEQSHIFRAVNLKNRVSGLSHGNKIGGFPKHSWTKGFTIRAVALSFFFGGFCGFIRSLLSALPPDFYNRWRKLFAELNARPDEDLDGKRKYGTRIYDVHGELITIIGPVKNPSSRVPNMHPSDIPASMWQAVVASEDRHFFEHHGVDPGGIARAILSLSTGGGGSTITQQLAKNVFLTSERRWVRKVVEILLALALELRMSKWDILYLYLKKIYWGHGVYGIEAASSFYFGKHASMLNLGECTMLAGMIPAPEVLSPFHDPSRGKRAQRRALCRMVEVGFLDVCTADLTLKSPLPVGTNVQGGSPASCKAAFFVDEVLCELKEKIGYKRVLEGGLQVHTTLDLRLQKIADKVIQDGLLEYDSERIRLAEEEIQRIFKKIDGSHEACDLDVDKFISRAYSNDVADQARGNESINGSDVNMSSRENYLCGLLQELSEALKRRLEAAMVVIDQSSGAVRVLVGGRDYYRTKMNRVTQAGQTLGSTFKPIVCLAALAEKIDLKKILSTGQSCSSALDVPIVKLCAKVGVDNVCKMAQLIGIKANLPCDLTLSIGAFKVTPLQLASAYSVIAAAGFHHKPYFVTRVETMEGEVIDRTEKSIGRAIVDEHAALEIRKMLQALIRKETGQTAQTGQGQLCGGKAGTSDAHKDLWFAGFTPNLTSVLWLGYDDNSPVGGVNPGTGASHAAPLWWRFMKSACVGQPGPQLEAPFMQARCRKHAQRIWKVHKKHIKLHQQVTRREQCSIKHWKDVYDWEVANSIWVEQEKMADWTAEHVKKCAKMKRMRSMCRKGIYEWLSSATS